MEMSSHAIPRILFCPVIFRYSTLHKSSQPQQRQTANSLLLRYSTLEKSSQPQPRPAHRHRQVGYSTLEKSSQPQPDVKRKYVRAGYSTLEKSSQPQRKAHDVKSCVVIALWKSRANRNPEEGECVLLSVIALWKSRANRNALVYIASLEEVI